MKESEIWGQVILTFLRTIAFVLVMMILVELSLRGSFSAELPPAAHVYWVIEAEGLDPRTGSVVVESFQASRIEFTSPESCIRAVVDIGPTRAIEGVVYVLRCTRVGPPERST